MRGAAHKYQRIVAVAHVLRYTQIFSTVKQLLDANAIGRLIHMDLIENVAYWHFAHSYVRGNWRRAGEASPMILAKSCHDLDLLRWLAGDTCISLSSVGGLSVFFAQNAPKGAARRLSLIHIYVGISPPPKYMGSRTNAVSYTHLDVYKRQVKYLLITSKEAVVPARRAESTAAAGLN